MSELIWFIFITSIVTVFIYLTYLLDKKSRQVKEIEKKYNYTKVERDYWKKKNETEMEELKKRSRP